MDHKKKETWNSFWNASQFTNIKNMKTGKFGINYFFKLKLFKCIHIKFKYHCRLKDIYVFFIAVPLHLNRQVITLLSGLGICNNYFQDLQETMLYELSKMLFDNDAAFVNLREVSLILSICLSKNNTFGNKILQQLSSQRFCLFVTQFVFAWFVIHCIYMYKAYNWIPKDDLILSRKI